jgi:hypothetical protein
MAENRRGTELLRGPRSAALARLESGRGRSTSAGVPGSRRRGRCGATWPRMPPPTRARAAAGAPPHRLGRVSRHRDGKVAPRVDHAGAERPRRLSPSPSPARWTLTPATATRVRSLDGSGEAARLRRRWGAERPAWAAPPDAARGADFMATLRRYERDEPRRTARMDRRDEQPIRRRPRRPLPLPHPRSGRPNRLARGGPPDRAPTRAGRARRDRPPRARCRSRAPR